jgi:hypothetical protein
MSKIENPDDVIGLCTDCGSDQPERYMYSSPFSQQGNSPPCKYCGGVVVVTYRENKMKTLMQSKKSRGIS